METQITSEVPVMATRITSGVREKSINRKGIEEVPEETVTEKTFKEY